MKWNIPNMEKKGSNIGRSTTITGSTSNWLVAKSFWFYGSFLDHGLTTISTGGVVVHQGLRTWLCQYHLSAGIVQTDFRPKLEQSSSHNRNSQSSKWPAIYGFTILRATLSKLQFNGHHHPIGSR
jgi:hypothetical protein